MKYYVYISDAKVDMLLQQISTEQKRKIETEFKFDLKVLSASRKAEIEPDNQITKLETVCEFLRNYSDVGIIDSPGSYLEGTLSMNWGPWLSWATDNYKSQMVYFGGPTRQTILGMGGSLKHVLGQGQDIPDSKSNLACILGALADDIQLQKPSYCRNMSEAELKQQALTAVEEANDMIRVVPPQRLEFLAKTFLFERSRSSGMNVLLGSPIYVAIADEEYSDKSDEGYN
jgi:hypothetical protein